MNLRNVLRAYSLLRQFTDDESAMLQTLRQATDAERTLIVEALSDKPQKKPGSERVYERCAQCGTTKGHRYHKDSSDDGYHDFQSPPKKSARASSLQQQIKGVAKGGTDRPLEALCVADLPNGAGRCGHEEDDPLHSDTSYGNAHIYQPPAVSTGKSDAQSAAGGL